MLLPKLRVRVTHTRNARRQEAVGHVAATARVHQSEDEVRAQRIMLAAKYKAVTPRYDPAYDDIKHGKVTLPRLKAKNNYLVERGESPGSNGRTPSPSSGRETSTLTRRASLAKLFGEAAVDEFEQYRLKKDQQAVVGGQRKGSFHGKPLKAPPAPPTRSELENTNGVGGTMGNKAPPPNAIVKKGRIPQLPTESRPGKQSGRPIPGLASDSRSPRAGGATKGVLHTQGPLMNQHNFQGEAEQQQQQQVGSSRTTSRHAERETVRPHAEGGEMQYGSVNSAYPLKEVPAGFVVRSAPIKTPNRYASASCE